jgi:hypothetical protein
VNFLGKMISMKHPEIMKSYSQFKYDNIKDIVVKLKKHVKDKTPITPDQQQQYWEYHQVKSIQEYIRQYCEDLQITLKTLWPKDLKYQKYDDKDDEAIFDKNTLKEIAV